MNKTDNRTNQDYVYGKGEYRGIWDIWIRQVLIYYDIHSYDTFTLGKSKSSDEGPLLLTWINIYLIAG